MTDKKERESKWDMGSARASVLRTGGKIQDNKITHPKPGIKVLGAIDYLVNYCKYIHLLHDKKEGKKHV